MQNCLYVCYHFDRELIAMDQGPDIIYIVDFVYIQVVVTGLMCLIFLPKASISFIVLELKPPHLIAYY